MRSQTKWGVFFIILGLLILVVSKFSIIAAIYSGLLILLGIALIIFRKREEIIEDVQEDAKNQLRKAN